MVLEFGTWGALHDSTFMSRYVKTRGLCGSSGKTCDEKKKKRQFTQVEPKLGHGRTMKSHCLH
jgi:hypothetical protein